MTFNPDEARQNHGKFGTVDDQLKDKPAPAAAAPQKTPQQAQMDLAKLAEAQQNATDVAGGHAPLTGLPQKPIQFANGDIYVPGPIGRLKDAAESYMKSAGLPYSPPTQYAKLDKDRAAKIAAEFENEKHTLDDPRVHASYEAMANETLAQWEAIKKTGLKVEWVKPGQADPYAESPRLAAEDVAKNNHWWGFPTDQGFGTGPEAEAYKHNNPLLRPTGETIDGRPVVVNDVFRIVHDMMGHLKEGNGFRGEGEENAWRSHASMYSDLARPAMTNETRGQNSWVNYGPYGATNRTANATDTHFAPQKIGLLLVGLSMKVETETSEHDAEAWQKHRQRFAPKRLKIYGQSLATHARMLAEQDTSRIHFAIHSALGEGLSNTDTAHRVIGSRENNGIEGATELTRQHITRLGRGYLRRRKNRMSGPPVNGH